MWLGRQWSCGAYEFIVRASQAYDTGAIVAGGTMFTKAPISSSVALLFIAGLAVTGCDDSTVPPPEETGDPETTASESQSDIDFPTNAEDYADALVVALREVYQPAVN